MPDTPLTWEEYTAAWSKLHGGFDPAAASPLVRGWVLTAYTIGSFLGRKRIGPSAVTTAGLILCFCVPLAVSLGRWGLLAGAVLVLLAALADSLDGAVAVITGTASRLGFVYDSVADRLGEAAWLLAFWLAGVPGPLVVAAGAVSWLQEYARARAATAGMTEIGVVTVAERPTRVLVAIFGLLLGALSGWLAGLAMIVWIALAITGLVQLTLAVRQQLGDQ
ncbi:CDP-alcohol phosphatidyltransferase family protein [Actinoplanes sp. NPDC026619]|uniref:CDP-alcohol phosphatidyltransferase family protein n=1 Tax=Actinoplanes sp. NPDC026619 TaxID=3155798 RepID=UPI0033D1A02A